MKKPLKEALQDAERRLDELLPDIDKRLKEAADENIEEPDHLRSGSGIDELELKRLIKEQNSENPAK
jgi:hypothetical protein